MMSAVGGGRGYPKSRCSKGGCVNLVLGIGPKCRQGGRGSKIPKILQTSYVHAPLSLLSSLNRSVLPLIESEKAQGGMRTLSYSFHISPGSETTQFHERPLSDVEIPACHFLAISFIFGILIYACVSNKDGNGSVMVREFDIVVLRTLPSPGRAEDEINKFSPTLTPKIPTLVSK